MDTHAADGGTPDGGPARAAPAPQIASAAATVLLIGGRARRRRRPARSWWTGAGRTGPSPARSNGFRRPGRGRRRIRDGVGLRDSGAAIGFLIDKGGAHPPRERPDAK